MGDPLVLIRNTRNEFFGIETLDADENSYTSNMSSWYEIRSDHSWKIDWVIN